MVWERVELLFYISEIWTLCEKMLSKQISLKSALGGEKDISPHLRSQEQQLIHLVHCYVNVPANSTPLCRLSRHDTFILL